MTTSHRERASRLKNPTGKLIKENLPHGAQKTLSEKYSLSKSNVSVIISRMNESYSDLLNDAERMAAINHWNKKYNRNL